MKHANIAGKVRHIAFLGNHLPRQCRRHRYFYHRSERRDRRGVFPMPTASWSR